jgi:hypothetical protein
VTPAAHILIPSNIKPSVITSALRFMVGVPPFRGFELETIRTVWDWDFIDFAKAVEMYFYNLVQTADQLVSFKLLLSAFQFLPRHYQLLDELAVLVDPRSICTIDEALPAPRTPLAEKRYHRALEASFFVLRTSWQFQTKPEASQPHLELHQVHINELETFLATHGLGHYKNVFAKCKVTKKNVFFVLVCSHKQMKMM